MNGLFFQPTPPLPTNIPNTTDGIVLLIGLGLAYAVFQNAGTGFKALIARYQSGTDAQLMQTSAFKTLMERLEASERRADTLERDLHKEQSLREEMQAKLTVIQTQLNTVTSESAAKDSIIVEQRNRIKLLEGENDALRQENQRLKSLEKKQE